MSARVATLSGIAVVLIATAAMGQNPKKPTERAAVTPKINTSAANARVIIPDGTSLIDAFSDGVDQWFIARLEGGKSYVLEAIDPYGDLTSNAIGTLSVWESDGTTPVTNTSVTCGVGASVVAPSLEVDQDGIRCVIVPFVGAAFPPKNVAFRVQQGGGSLFHIRLRESTIFSRWTVNGYDMHIELQNTTADQADVQVCLFGDTGGSGTPVVGCDSLAIPGWGSAKLVKPAGSIAPNRGTLRVIGSTAGGNYVPGQINLQTYAYNPAVGNYLFFVSEKVNDGRGANDFQLY
jgi:hypothetical protein